MSAVNFAVAFGAGVVVCWILSLAFAGWAARHRHRWRVVALDGGSWSEGSFAYLGMLDRCDCGRFRWRPNAPLPPWWPISYLNRLDAEHDLEAERLQVWLNAMPHWRQRHERKAVKRQLAWATAREQRTAQDVSDTA